MNLVLTIPVQIGKHQIKIAIWKLTMDPLLENSNKILIIANGGSILKNEFCEAIDSFPIVGRINNYITKGYEKHIGTKTDIWFHGANQRVKPRNNIPKRVVVMVPPKILQKIGKNINKRVGKRQRLSSEQYELVSIENMKKYEKMCSVERLPTGTNSILWAIDNFETVIIHGFDFFIKSKTHYFDNKITKFLINNNLISKGKKHSMDQEKKYIEKLISNRIIHQLSEFKQEKL